MKDGTFFDAVYFGHEPGERKSNYPAVGGYTDETGAPKLFAEWVDSHFSRRKKKKKVLEVGCATGAAVREMRKIGIEAYGCDASEYILGLAGDDVKEYLYHVDMRELENSQLADEAPFDLIVSKDVLEHATEDVIRDILISFSRLAKKQAHIVNTGEFDYQAANGDATHFLIKPLDWWNDLAEELDLDIDFKHT